ncbi:MAG: hypothetical protein KGQ75_01225 [Sphingomonadales bacterium]|nr:hypothetical protein [Sphingomonadales bacterium]
MSIFKIAFAGAAMLSMVLIGSAANAEPVRAGAAIPGVVSVKKFKMLRAAAPSKRESREGSGTDVGLGLLAAGIAGFGVYEATKSDSTGG